MPALSAVPLPGAAGAGGALGGGGQGASSDEADDDLLANAGFCLG